MLEYMWAPWIGFRSLAVLGCYSENSLSYFKKWTKFGRDTTPRFLCLTLRNKSRWYYQGYTFLSSL